MQTKFENTDDFLSSDEYREYVLGRSANKDKKWDAYFKNNPEMKVCARKAQKIIIGLSSMKDSTADSEVSELQMQHNFEKAWKKYRDSQSNNLVKNASGFLRRGLAVAAAIVFAVVIYTLLDKFIINSPGNSVFSEIYVPPAKQSQLTLPDGSMVWLNADSRLKYSNQFNLENRDVYLQGEAYFEVEDNSKVPFKVISDRAVVKVTGTKFNVRAYPDEDRIEAVLAEGKVVLNTKNGITEKCYELNPGDKAIYDLISNLLFSGLFRGGLVPLLIVLPGA
jgi:ferric-dicitrate binding protein FerR (iron transport regulator)